MKKPLLLLVLGLFLSGRLIAQTSQTIPLQEGWSMFSTYLIPDNPLISDVLMPLFLEVKIVKSGAGGVFWPQFNINSIGNMQIGSGYQIKMNSAQNLSISGTELNPTQTTLLLPYGWNILGYLHQSPALLVNMLSSLNSQLIIAKNGSGQTYWPQFNVNNIVQLIPGQGYLMKLSDSALFTYPSLLPDLNTLAISGVTQTSAQGGGNILHPGGNLVSARGICWNTTGNPTTNDDYTTDGTGTGAFTSSLTGLSPNTPFYVRAYATNSLGTAYGNEVLFSTLANLATLTTTAVSAITQTTATSGGEITSDGGAMVTARGLCWNSTGNPTIADNITMDSTGSGAFSSTLTGLNPNTSYFARAYATNSQGTAYGNELSFTTLGQPAFACGTSTVSDYDGNNYNTVQIGSQCWMKENLRTKHYANGMAIPLVTGEMAWYNLTNTDKAYCLFDNSLTNEETYGCLYNWPAAMNGFASSTTNPSGVQGACPNGWHLPSDNEWKQLERFLGMTNAQADANGDRGTVQGGKLKANSLWNSPNYGASNSSGFTALPGGIRTELGSFQHLGNYGFWWTASESGSSGAWYRILNYNNAMVNRSDWVKNNGRSVRCLRDNAAASAQMPTLTTTAPGDITLTTATCGGEVTSDGGAPVTARGVCWNTTGAPSISDSFTTDGTGAGVFTSSITGLIPNTTYFIRAYATNLQGTDYGDLLSFTTFVCGTSTVSDFDGNTYNSVQIGNQCWMKENLRAIHYANGTAIPLVTDNIAWNNLYYSNKAYCYYNNLASNAATYGALYTWAAAMNGYGSSTSNPSGVQGACPNGWHVPSDNEWKQMEMFLGMTQAQADGSGWRGTDQGGKLKSTTLWTSPNTGATNSSGFTALPAGARENFGSFSGLGTQTYWWTTSETSSSDARYRGLLNSNIQVYRSASTKDKGHSIRCLK